MVEHHNILAKSLFRKYIQSLGDYDFAIRLKHSLHFHSSVNFTYLVVSSFASLKCLLEPMVTTCTTTIDLSIIGQPGNVCFLLELITFCVNIALTVDDQCRRSLGGYLNCP